MPYINIGQLIEPYLRPLGKQTIAQIPGIQEHQLAKERLGSQKQVWSEEIAQSQQSRQIQKGAEAEKLKLLGLARTNPEAFAKMVPPNMDPEMFLRLNFSGAMGDLQPQYPKAHTPAWKEVQPGKWVDVASPEEQGREYPQPESIAEKRLKILRQKHLSDVEKHKADTREKRRKEDIKYWEGEVEYALETDDQNYLTESKTELSKLVGASTSGIKRDPEIDKARAMIMEANEKIRLYEKASQDSEDKGAPLAPTSTPEMPPRQFVMPPAKKTAEGPKEPTFTEKRSTAKDVSTAEQAILNPDNEGNPALVGPISIFNRFSDKPYMYIWTTKKEKKGIIGFRKEVDVGKTKKIDLPVLNGKQVKASDIWFTAQEEGKTLEEVLKMIGVIE